ncbi:hypothetical protein K7X08_036447 [Anisodus acutangulus]|uniref:Uncharacterized protein n=1 Tax=Anisodus acutangulus TaxID=402998 RepID=A0A9Q1L8B1_9SOLA|nr:hypothetical protein K7X08_036447 [Anisodus acutangulus]
MALPITGLNNNEYHISRGQVLNGKVGLDQSCSFVRVVKLQIKLIFYELCNNSWLTESLLTQYLPLNSSWSTFTKNLVVPIKNESFKESAGGLI